MRGPVTVYTNAENAICVYSLGGNTRSIQLDLVLCNISFGHLSAEYFMNAADQTRVFCNYYPAAENAIFCSVFQTPLFRLTVKYVLINGRRR